MVPNHYKKYGKKFYEKNREKELERNRRYYLENRDAKLARHRATVLKSRYGITEEEYLQMVSARDGKCDICGIVYTRTLNVDHCHDKGHIRGLLCNNCNRGIGHLKDNVTILKNAIKYLEAVTSPGKGELAVVDDYTTTNKPRDWDIW